MAPLNLGAGYFRGSFPKCWRDLKMRSVDTLLNQLKRGMPAAAGPNEPAVRGE
jgi:hypothetical protein